MIQLVDGVDRVLVNGDCLKVLKELPENSVDSIVTDPPYGLSFMGKKWDYDVPSVEVWKECFRVLKPGAFLLSFSGTRTYHRMAVNIEDAGFGIRDMISWLYGSGFPKSHNIGKSVDKIQGNEREKIAQGISGKEETHLVMNMAYTENGKSNMGGEKDITKGNSEWEGWGTALKPACEPIVVARKPISEKNIALNVLKWGTGGINIDGCRVEHNEPIKETKREERQSETWKEGSGFKNEEVTLASPNPQGRFPANIILDEEAGKILDEQSGISKSIPHSHNHNKTPSNIFDGGTITKGETISKFSDKGGASRFFYCAKASKSERNFGCEDMPLKHYLKENKMGGEKDTMLTGSGNPRDCRKRNNHPTVKPIKLMQYLVRLVTPKNAVCLDPFMGSGTTGIACKKEEIRFIGIEREEEYMKIASARIEA